MRARMRWSVILRVALLGAAVVLIAVDSRGFAEPGRAEPLLGPGVALGYGGGGHELDILGPVWYFDYEFATPSWPNHPRLYFVDLSKTPRAVVEVARKFPGQWWTYGNEPNDPNQDNIQPDAYVRPYHDLYYALKSADPQARLVPTGVANADWHWLDQWREKYRQTYGRYPPVDGWRFHNYLLDTCEGALSVDQFMLRAIGFRDWVTRIGDSARPIFLTEYGVLYGNGCCSCPLIAQEAVVQYMKATTSWLIESRVVTAWAWFAVDTDNRYNGDLFSGGQLLATGAAYQGLVNESRLGPK